MSKKLFGNDKLSRIDTFKSIITKTITTEPTDSIFDSSDGNLTLIYDSINNNEFTFVYLYANWCARSMSYRELIESLASKFSAQVQENYI